MVWASDLVVAEDVRLTSVSASLSSVIILEANEHRKRVMLYNNSNSFCCISFLEVSSTALFSFKMSPGSMYECFDNPIYLGDISAIWLTSSTGSMMVTEM